MLSFDEYKNIIDNHLLDFIPEINEYASKISESMKYSLTVGGKRIRPVLLLAACDFAGGDLEQAIPYACAIEYIHTYSLIHDDLPAMDDDDIRRGKATNHKVYGEDIAILAGDALLNTAAQVLYSQMIINADKKSSSNHAKAGYEIMSAAGVEGMIAGQVADVINQNKKCSAELVDYIQDNKTGKLLTAPVIAGLHLAGASDEMINDFQIYSKSLGKAFQVSDDILDYGEDGNSSYANVHGIDEAKSELHKLTVKAIESIEKYGEKAYFFKDLALTLETREA